MQSSGTVHVRKKVVKEFEIAFAIKDHHWQPVWIFRCSDDAGHVLRNDVLQKRGLAGTGHAEHNALHDAHSVRPVPRLAMDVVAEDHGILLPGFGRRLFVPFADNHRWMGPMLLPAGARGGNQYGGAGDGQAAESQVACHLGYLAVRPVVTLTGYVPGEPAPRHQNEGNCDLHALQDWRVLLPVGVRFAHHYYYFLFFGLNTQRMRNPKEPQNTNPHDRPK